MKIYQSALIKQKQIVNAFILAFDYGDCTIVQPDNISACMRLPFANRSAAGGVGYGQLPNGGDQGLYQDNLWTR